MDRPVIAPLDLERLHNKPASSRDTDAVHSGGKRLTILEACLSKLLLTKSSQRSNDRSPKRSHHSPSINRSVSSSPASSPTALPPSQLSRQSLEGYQIGEVLGMGAFGRVYRATRNSDGATVVIKCVNVPPRGQRYDEHATSEIEALSVLSHHPSVMHMHDHWYQKIGCVYYMVLEHCEVDLFTVMRAIIDKSLDAQQYPQRTVIRRFPEDVVRNIFRQVAAAIAFAHSQHYAHLDLKLENVMFVQQPDIDARTNLEVRVGDWGFSRYMDVGPCSIFRAMRGSPEYLCPELLLGLSYTGVAADSWALGVILYAMFSMALPFLDVINNSDSHHRAVHAEYPPLPKTVSTEAHDMVRALLTSDAQRRMTAFQACRTLWLSASSPRELTNNS